MKEKLALAMGHILGDGGINNKGRVYYCNTEKFLIEEFVDSMNVFRVNPWIGEEKNITRVVYSVVVGRKLWELFGKFSSGKDTKIITKEIQRMPLKWKVKMLQAWFDDDGSVVNFPPNYKVVSIKQKLKPLIIFIKEILDEYRISSKISEDNEKWLLRIIGYENLLKFKGKIGFSKGYRKQEQLNEMLDSINRPHFIVKKKILNLLKESSKTKEEISRGLDLSRGVVYGHLHGWKRKKRESNPGLIDLGLVRVRKEGKINIYSLSPKETHNLI